MVKVLSISLFLAGYALISQEHRIKVSKTAVSLLLGVGLWSLVILFTPHASAENLLATNSTIFELVIFLLSAMTLVEIITHFGLFDFIYLRIQSLRLDARMQFFVLAGLAFLFSTFINNITTTIVFVYIATRLFRGETLVKTAAAIVIATNAGGVFSPIGDVTSTMLWLNGKFTSADVFLQGFLPALSSFLVSTALLGRSIPDGSALLKETRNTILPAEWVIIVLCCLSYFLPLVMTLLNIPAYMGLLFGLAIVWLAVEIFKPHLPKESRMDISIEKFFQKTDIAGLYFFVGILLAVSALSYLGILHDISQYIYSATPSTERVIWGNVVLGLVSAVFDNIPLTAASIEIVKTTSASLWVLLSYTVGFGGSLFLIGSGSGIVAMTIVKELTFTKYLRIASLPVLLAYFTGILVWYAQFVMFK